MNYKDGFAIDELPYNQLKKENHLQASKYQLNNFSFYEPKLVHDFYLKYFTNNLLFETDILELKDFLEYHYDYCDNPIKYYEILDFKILPKIEEIIENAELSFSGHAYYNGKELEYDFTESEGVIHNGNYEYHIMYHKVAARKLQHEFRKRVLIIQKFIEEYKDKVESKPLRWIAGPAQLGVIISELIDKGYMEADLRRGEINYARLSKEIFKAFSVKDCDTPKSIEIYLSPNNKRNKKSKNLFVQNGFNIPDVKFT